MRDKEAGDQSCEGGGSRKKLSRDSVAESENGVSRKKTAYREDVGVLGGLGAF